MGVMEVILKQAREEGLQQGLEQGLQQGAEQKSREFVSNLITMTDLCDTDIAKAVVVPIDFVRKVRIDLDKKKK